MQSRGARAAALLRGAAGWAAPPIFLILLYRYSFKAWFLHDDFAWLAVATYVHNWQDLLQAVFQPTIHGTFRPFSERASFLIFHWLFGLDAFPFRVLVFVTQIGSLTLVNAIMRRLTGSATAGVLASVFWLVQAKLATSLTWASAYMQVLCGFCLLLAFYCWLRHTQTGERRWWVAVWAVFLFGFGVMETNLVFPALAGVYALFYARSYLKKVLVLSIPSVGFVLLHMWIVPKQAVGPYSVHVDAAMVKTFGQYWFWALNPGNPEGFRLLPVWSFPVILGAFTLLLVSFTAWSVYRKQWLPLVLLSWFVILLAPVLPLRNHVADYYVGIPFVGLAMLGSYALVSAFRLQHRGRNYWSAIGIVAAVLFVAVSAPAARQNSKNIHQLSVFVERMLKGVAQARLLHPDKILLLDGVNNELFIGGICDGGFNVVGVRDLYLAPGSEKRIASRPGICDPANFTLPAEATEWLLEREQMMVYREGGPRLRNITHSYLPVNSGLVGKRLGINLGAPASKAFLGAGWYPADGELRWMGRRASIRVPPGFRSGRRLTLFGACSERQLQGGPLTLKAYVGNELLGQVRIATSQAFQHEFAIPSKLPEAAWEEIVLEVDRTMRAAGESRDLGLAFRSVEIR